MKAVERESMNETLSLFELNSLVRLTLEAELSHEYLSQEAIVIWSLSKRKSFLTPLLHVPRQSAGVRHGQ